MKKLLLFLIIVSVAVLYSGCTSAKLTLAQNVAKFQSGRFEEAHKGMGELLKKVKSETYPLYQLTDASILYALGDHYDGCDIMGRAANNLEVELGSGTVALDLVGSEENVHYRGYVHERVLARYYHGLGYFARGYYDSAKIAFIQAIERDINKEKGKENAFASVHFMLGETFLRLKEYDNARVAFQNVIKLQPSNAYGWYKLATINFKIGDKEEAQKAYQTYKDSLGSEPYLPIDGSGSYIFLLLDIGWGPTLSPDAITGAFSSYQQVSFPERYVSIVIDKNIVPSKKVEDVYMQAKDEANLTGDVSKKVASVAVKKAIQTFIPFGGLLTGSTDADVRKWLLLPGEIHIALIPTEQGVHDVTLKFFDAKMKELKDYQQSWYYVPAGTEGEAPLVQLRSLFQLQNQKKKEK
ncbi:MAG: hypothetical protein C0417_00815 [Chlorobiaceae bacterium]|nr:hypothetical protein [Chlorobiaceae bacterium]